MTNEQARSSTWETGGREAEKLQRGGTQSPEAKTQGGAEEAMEPGPFAVNKRKPRGGKYTKQVLLSMARKTESGCWEWACGKDDWGYGKTYFNQRTEKAHRVAWRIFNCEIPPGMLVLHKCDNPPCINPWHLFLGTNRDNMLDASRKGRLARRKKQVNQQAKHE